MNCGADLCLASSSLSVSPCGIFSPSSHMCLLFIDDLFFFFFSFRSLFFLSLLVTMFDEILYAFEQRLCILLTLLIWEISTV